MKFPYIVLYLLLILVPVRLIADTLVLTAPPRESTEAGNKMYQPLAAYLTRLLNKEVVYNHSENWLNYQREMRADKYDIVFDGPHFAAWRLKNLQHRMVVKLDGNLQFHLVSTHAAQNIENMGDLIGKPVCGISPPNLSSLTVLAEFNNPVRQPFIKGIRGGMGKVYESLINNTCPAAVLRTTFYDKKLSDKQRKQMKILYTSQPVPNQVITVSKRVNEADRVIMQGALLNDVNATAALQSIQNRFGEKGGSFILASNEEYDGNQRYLEGVIFGW